MTEKPSKSPFARFVTKLKKTFHGKPTHDGDEPTTSPKTDDNEAEEIPDSQNIDSHPKASTIMALSPLESNTTEMPRKHTRKTHSASFARDTLPSEDAKPDRHSVGAASEYSDYVKYDFLYMQSDEYLKLVPGAKDHPRRPSIAVSEDGMTMTRPYRNHLLDSPAASSAIIQLKESTRSRCGSTHMNSRPSEPTLFHTKTVHPMEAVNILKDEIIRVGVARDNSEELLQLGCVDQTTSRTFTSVRRPSFTTDNSSSNYLATSHNHHQVRRRHSELLDPKKMRRPERDKSRGPSVGASPVHTPRGSVHENIMKAMQDEFTYMKTADYRKSVASME